MLIGQLAIAMPLATNHDARHIVFLVRGEFSVQRVFSTSVDYICCVIIVDVGSDVFELTGTTSLAYTINEPSAICLFGAMTRLCAISWIMIHL